MFRTMSWQTHWGAPKYKKLCACKECHINTREWICRRSFFTLPKVLFFSLNTHILVGVSLNLSINQLFKQNKWNKSWSSHFYHWLLVIHIFLHKPRKNLLKFQIYENGFPSVVFNLKANGYMPGKAKHYLIPLFSRNHDLFFLTKLLTYTQNYRENIIITIYSISHLLKLVNHVL